MKTYLNLMQKVLTQGVDRPDRTGTGTRSLFGEQMRYDLALGFPAMTTKKLAWKSVVSELLWFIEGSGDERRLAEILFGTRDEAKKTIWTDNAEAAYWKPKAKYEGDLGRVYGVQWRNWKTYQRSELWNDTTEDLHTVYVEGKPIDQLSNLIRDLKADPYGRRHILTAMNVGELDQMALPPCHTFAQFYVLPDHITGGMKLSCQLYQRSADLFLGVPFNIASYALFTHMIAQVCGYGVGELVHTIGDAHIYHNHFVQAEEQIERDPFPLATLWLDPSIKEITDFKMHHIALNDYQSHAAIKAPMAV